MNIDYTKYKFDKSEFLDKIIIDCYTEMYERAQPSANFKELCDEYKKIRQETGREEKFYDKYYLSQEEYEYIVEKYIEKYRLMDDWHDNIDLLLSNIKEGYSVDKYIPANGNSPGYRSYEHKPRFEETYGKEITDKFIAFLEERKNFYRFNHDADCFRNTMALGASPTSNSDTVIEYWKTQGIDLQIEPRHLKQDDFWCEEHGYTNDEEEDE